MGDSGTVNVNDEEKDLIRTKLRGGYCKGSGKF